MSRIEGIEALFTADMPDRISKQYVARLRAGGKRLLVALAQYREAEEEGRLTCEGCIHFNDMDDFVPCHGCKRLVRTNDYYTRAEPGESLTQGMSQSMKDNFMESLGRWPGDREAEQALEAGGVE